MRTDESLVVTRVELIQDPEDESAGLVDVVAEGREMRVSFYGSVGDRWMIGRSVFVTLTTESKGDWVVTGSPRYSPAGYYDDSDVRVSPEEEDV